MQQMVLELEMGTGRADVPDSIMDRVLAGLITDAGECRTMP